MDSPLNILTRPPINSPRQLVLSSTCSLIYLFSHLLVLSSTCSLIYLFSHQLVLSSTCSPVNSSSHQLVLPSTRPLFNSSSLQLILPSTHPLFNSSSLQLVPLSTSILVLSSIRFCLLFSYNFNIMSALVIHQTPTRPQKIDSREGWFWYKKGLVINAIKMNTHCIKPHLASDFGLFVAKHSAFWC